MVFSDGTVLFAAQLNLILSDIDRLTEENATQEIEIIELVANAGVDAQDSGTLVQDTFSDSDGYRDTVNTGNTTATFNTNKYERANVGGEWSHWKMNEASGNGIDASGNGRDLTENGTIGNQTGKINGARGALTLNNTFSRTTSIATNATDDYSIACWVKNINTTVTGNDAFVFIKRDAGGANYVEFYANNTTIIAESDAPARSQKAITWSLNQWYHFVMVHDGTSKTHILYVDGAAQTASGTTSTVGGSQDRVFVGDISVGGGQEAASFYIDDVRLFDRTLDAGEVATLYNSGTGTENSLAASDDKLVEIDLPATITGTVTDTYLFVNAPDREAGDAVTYDLIDASTNEDSGLASSTGTSSTKNTLVNVDGTDLGGGTIKINLEGKASSPTTGVPSVKTYCLVLVKS